MREGVPERAAQPGGEQGVAAYAGGAAGAGGAARAVGHVPGDEGGAVGDAPATCFEVHGQQGFLGAEVEYGVVAAGFQEGVPAGDGGAAQEAEDGRSRQVGLAAERGGGEDRVERVGVGVGARTDEGAGGGQSQPGVGREHLGGAGQGAGFPPGVVVAERDERCVECGGTVRTADRAEVAAGGEDPYGGETRADGGRGAVRRAVVHDHDGRCFGQPRHSLQCGEQPLAPVPGDHDDAHQGRRPGARRGHGVRRFRRRRRHDRYPGPGAAARAARRASAVVDRPSR